MSRAEPGNGVLRVVWNVAVLKIEIGKSYYVPSKKLFTLVLNIFDLFGLWLSEKALETVSVSTIKGQVLRVGHPRPHWQDT